MDKMPTPIVWRQLASETRAATGRISDIAGWINSYADAEATRLVNELEQAAGNLRHYLDKRSA